MNEAYIFIYDDEYRCMCMYVCMHVCMHLCVCMCVYIYIYIYAYMCDNRLGNCTLQYCLRFVTKETIVTVFELLRRLYCSLFLNGCGV